MSANHPSRSKPARIRRERVVSILDRIVRSADFFTETPHLQQRTVAGSLIEEARAVLAEETRSNGEPA